MSESEVAEFFESNVDEYSADLKVGSDEKLSFVRETFGDETGIEVLDVGCGSGAFADEIAKVVDTGHVFGTEIAREMFSEESVGVNFLLSDAQHLPFESSFFSLIHIDTVLHHIVGNSRSESKRKAKKAFSELFRILKPGGYILLTERVQKGRLLSDNALSYAIFYGLQYGSKLLQPFHPQVHETQPPICFYTSEEISSMVEENGGTIVDRDVFRDHPSHPLDRPFRSASLRVTFYIRKN